MSHAIATASRVTEPDTDAFRWGVMRAIDGYHSMNQGKHPNLVIMSFKMQMALKSLGIRASYVDCGRMPSYLGLSVFMDTSLEANEFVVAHQETR